MKRFKDWGRLGSNSSREARLFWRKNSSGNQSARQHSAAQLSTYLIFLDAVFYTFHFSCFRASFSPNFSVTFRYTFQPVCLLRACSDYGPGVNGFPKLAVILPSTVQTCTRRHVADLPCKHFSSYLHSFVHCRFVNFSCNIIILCRGSHEQPVRRR